MIDAACNAVAKDAGVDANLIAFQVAAVTPGSDAVGDVAVQVEVAGQRVSARGVSTAVVEASARALLDAVNKVLGGTAVARRPDKPWRALARCPSGCGWPSSAATGSARRWWLRASSS